MGGDGSGGWAANCFWVVATWRRLVTGWRPLACGRAAIEGRPFRDKNPQGGDVLPKNHHAPGIPGQIEIRLGPLGRVWARTGDPVKGVVVEVGGDWWCGNGSAWLGRWMRSIVKAAQVGAIEGMPGSSSGAVKANAGGG